MAKRSKKTGKPTGQFLVKKLAELREHRNFLMGQMDLAIEPRRIIHFQLCCMIIGIVVMALPILIHGFFPSRASPFGNPPRMGVGWTPLLALAILAISWRFTNKRIYPSGSEEKRFISSMRIGAFFIAAIAVLMVVTGVSDLQTEFTVPERVAAIIESFHKGNQTNPIALHWVICGFVGLSVVTLFQLSYVRIVVKPSWFYRQSLLELSNDSIAESKSNNPHTRSNTNQKTRSKYSLVEARYRTRFLLGGVYVVIAVSAYLYFLFGRQRYMRDPIAVSFGFSAYLLNVVLVFEAFRARWACMAEIQADSMTSERASDFARIWRWSLGTAAGAIVYNLLLAYGALDNFTKILQKSLIPGWAQFQTWALSNLIVLIILNILCSLIAGWIGQSLSSSLQRQKRDAGQSVNPDP